MLFRLRNYLLLPLGVLGILAGCNGSRVDSAPFTSCSLTSTKIILNGTPCEGELPIAQITLFYQAGSPQGCTGVLIKSDTILTAAHCVIGTTRVDASFSSERWSNVRVAIHPAFRRDDQRGVYFYDYALLSLSGHSTLEPVTLTAEASPQVGDTLKVFGFGSSASNLDGGTLEAGEMMVTEQTHDHILSQFTKGASYTCLGDSGGPAFLATPSGVQLVGITSTGTLADCGEGDVTYFARTNRHDVIDWIR